METQQNSDNVTRCQIATFSDRDTRVPHMKKTLTDAILYREGFDFSKRELKILWHLVNKMPFVHGDLLPVKTTDASIAKVLHMNACNVSTTLKALTAMGIVQRLPGAVKLNMPDLWPVPMPKPKAKNLSEMETPESEAEFPKRKVELSKTDMPEFPKRKVELSKTETMIGSERASDNGLGDPLDLMRFTSIETSHEGGGEGRLLDRQDELPSEQKSTHSRMRELVVQATDVLRDRGFPKPPSSPDPGFAFKHYIESVILRRAMRNSAEPIDAADFLEGVVIPALKDIPNLYLADFASYDRELTFKIGRSRDVGGYVNLWAKAPQVNRGMMPVSDFSTLEADVVSDL